MLPLISLCPFFHCLLLFQLVGLAWLFHRDVLVGFLPGRNLEQLDYEPAQASSFQIFEPLLADSLQNKTLVLVPVPVFTLLLVIVLPLHLSKGLLLLFLPGMFKDPVIVL